MEWFETPLGAVGAGLTAALAGTIAMSAYQYLVIGIQSLGSSDEAEQADSTKDPWEEASAPAQVGYRLVKGLFGTELGPEWIGRMTQITHFGYGTAWGLLFGLVQGTVDGPPIALGLAFGLFVWAGGYPPLIAMGLYKPPWKYPAGTVALEISYHLLYGLTTGLAFEALTRL